MGYSEIYCKLCGVSFNVGRIRKADDPWESAWHPQSGEPGSSREYYRDSSDYNLYDNSVTKSPYKPIQCPKEAGCRDVERQEVIEKVFGETLINDNAKEDEDEYFYQPEDDREALEYGSDSELVEDEDGDEGEDDGEENVPDDEKKTQGTIPLLEQGNSIDAPKSAGDEAATEIIAQASPPHPSPISFNSDRSSDDEDFYTYYGKCLKFEHLAGPGCIHYGGYSGHGITAEQMRGCTTVQCLVRKTPEWRPGPDDQSFELDGKYFLTGLSGGMPSRDKGNPQFVPIRHGHEGLFPDTGLSSGSDDAHTPMPFHPTCFEIYARASRPRNHNRIDVLGLAAWRNIESTYIFDLEFPRHPAVKRGSEQEWDHHPGDEWLAANPVVVPLLPEILQRSILRGDEDEPVDEAARDPFTRLPQELSNAVLAFLEPVEIASLRQASCLKHIPLSSWREPLQEEMPWLWEVWDPTHLASFWATTSVPTLVKEMLRREDVEKQLNEQRAIIEEEMPEILEKWWEEHKVEHKPYALCSDLSLAKELPKPAEWNYCRLYYEIKTSWEWLKGLRNRERIWTDVQEILRRIAMYRDEGRIPS